MEKFVLFTNNKNQLSLYTDSMRVINKFINQVESVTKTIPTVVKYLGSVDTIDEKENYIFYKNDKVKSVFIDKENNIASLSLDEENLFIPDLIYLAICMMANRLQKEHLYFVQSSIVKYDDNNGIMFLGDPNSGKTSLASKLLLTGNWSLVCNDNALVDIKKPIMRTIDGTKSVQMRLGVIKLYFKSLLDDINIIDNKKSEWDIKIYVDDFFKNKNVKLENETSITDIYHVDTIRNGDIYIRAKEFIDSYLLIYEHLTKQIRSNRYILTSFDYPIPSFDSEKYSEQRCKYVKAISENTNVFEVKGDMDKIVKVLRKKYEK